MIPSLVSSSSSLPCRAYALLVSSNLSPYLIPTAPLSSLPSAILARRCQRRGSSLGPNAESVRGGRFRFRDETDGGEEGGDSGEGRRPRWWSDRNREDGLEEEFDYVDYDDEEGEPLWEKIWIFKVFKSYGYLLPAIIVSMLLATGPKAFLMALAVPVAQSAISLAIDKLWGSREEEPSTNRRVRRKPFSRSSPKQERSETGGEAHQSWAAPDADLNGGKPSGSDRRSFGGWDELDQQRAQASRRPPGSERPCQFSPVKMGRLSKKGRYGDTPLFLRLLIAVFPFLGSWTRML